ncbi:hypothetical protein LY78DRAFT_220001 [Colletotrichum sublineola]|nr:hypothetical protein LY78DRAFT_220001 [Colletotrichum sublineola]
MTSRSPLVHLGVTYLHTTHTLFPSESVPLTHCPSSSLRISTKTFSAWPALVQSRSNPIQSRSSSGTTPLPHPTGFCFATVHLQAASVLVRPPSISLDPFPAACLVSPLQSNHPTL